MSAKPSQTARAQAAAWIARLHGPNRTPEVDAGFRQWIAEDPAHAEAFELLTDTWEKSSRLRRRPWEQPAIRSVSTSRRTFNRTVFATLAAMAIGASVFVYKSYSGVVSTDVGEQRTSRLEDGTRVYLNTDTRVAVHYDRHTRSVSLERGEAMFEVAEHADRPFIVVAGDRRIKALGTSFIVRRDAQLLEVTLVQGKVTVSPSNDARPDITQPAADERVGGSGSGRADAFTLSPGERLTLAGNGPPVLDRPAIERISAWQHGQVSLDNTPLAEAVAEMNRYSDIQIVVDGATGAAIRVSGIFRAGDSDDFAQAIAKSYGLRVQLQGRRIILSGG